MSDLLEKYIIANAGKTCVAGSTEIATLFDGGVRIDHLTNTKKERFPIYAYNFETQDYTIAWAFDPRFVKTCKTINIILDNGEVETVTEDHRILLRNGNWKRAIDLMFGTELMPFHRIKANQHLTKIKIHQYPRLYTFKDGWIHERQFIDEWRLGKNLVEYDKANYFSRLITNGLKTYEIAKITKHAKETIESCISRYGFSRKELRYLQKNHPDRRRIIGISPGIVQDVFDLSVENHQNFCTNSLVMHNCMLNEKIIKKYTISGCFFCLKKFESNEIHSWTDDGKTALCPYCNTDTLIPEDDINNPITEDLLKKIKSYWL